MTLTEFLLARIAEDEADAQASIRDLVRWKREQRANGPDGSQGRIVITRLFDTASDPSRVLAECEAKRQIVRAWPIGVADSASHAVGARAMKSHVLHLLALPYADHPDYREEWKP